MNPRELVDHIRSGPSDLLLDKPLRFRRRLCPNPCNFNPCNFNEFLQALQTSETIRTVNCESYRELGISEDEWVLLVKTLGSIKNIQHLDFFCTDGSPDFDPFQAVADAVNNAQSLCELVIGLDGETFPRDSSGLTALANALREHTSLQEFTWFDFDSRLEAAQITAVDPVLWALPACPHLRKVVIMTKCASADTRKNLLQLHSATNLRIVLETDLWLAVADEIRRGRCNVQTLTLSLLQAPRSEAAAAVKAVASAIQLDCNLERLYLQMDNGFTDEAGVALAEALTVNKNLRKLHLSVKKFVHHSHQVQNKATLGTQSYEAFTSMLRVNTSLVLELPPLDIAVRDERLFESCGQMRIEQRLNKVGRGKLLSSSQTTKEEWVDALHELSSNEVDESDAFRLSCIISLFRLNPEVVSMS
jgi:hypothetical protein